MSAKEHRPQRLVWPLQAMPLARAMSLVYAFLIFYVSLNPFDFDFHNGISAWAWLDAPLPRFITLFDVSLNILAHIPFGFLLVFASYPRWQNFVALGIALALSAALAFGVETLQSWIPSRIPSLMDWWANNYLVDCWGLCWRFLWGHNGCLALRYDAGLINGLD